MILSLRGGARGAAFLAGLWLCLYWPGAVPLVAQENPPGGDYSLPDEDWEEAPVLEDGGITITGTRETTQQMKVVTRAEIEKANAPDLASLLEETAGLGTARYGPRGSQGDINLRGFDSERVAFLIDGIPANSPGSSEFDFNQIDLNSIERIEIIYGGSDSRYNVSGAFGGVINIITVKKQKPGLRVGGSISNMSALPGAFYRPRGGNRPAGNQGARMQDLFDTQNVALSAGMGLGAYSFKLNWFGNRAGNHFLYTDNFDRTRRKENSEVWDTGLSAALIREFEDLSKLIVNGSFYYGDKNFTDSGYSDSYSKYLDFSSRENIMLEMPRAFHDTLETEASISHSVQRLDSSGSITSYHAVGAINRWAWYPQPFLTLRTGADYRYALADAASFHDRHDGGLYVTAEWSPAETISLIPSLKFAVNSGGQFVPVPKFGVVWKPAPALTVKNNYFRSFKFPDLEDLYWRGGNMSGDSNLKPEDGWGADIGAAWKTKTGSGLGLGLDGNAYLQWYDNSIHWYGTGGVWKPQNVGGAFFFGGDANARAELPFENRIFKSLSFSLSYQYMISYLLAYGYDFDSNKRIPYMPEHTLGITGELSWKSGSALVSARYESRRYADTANLSVLPGHFLADLSANQRVTDTLTAFAAIRNLFNTSYQSFKDYPMPGITLTLGLKAAFEFGGE